MQIEGDYEGLMTELMMASMGVYAVLSERGYDMVEFFAVLFDILLNEELPKHDAIDVGAFQESVKEGLVAAIAMIAEERGEG